MSGTLPVKNMLKNDQLASGCQCSDLQLLNTMHNYIKHTVYTMHIYFLFYIMVLASDSWSKGSYALYVSSLAVDEGWIRRVSNLNPLQSEIQRVCIYKLFQCSHTYTQP